MKKFVLAKFCAVMSLGILQVSQPAFAEAPALKNKAPFIYLADNLDEDKQLGWCIDTLGRGRCQTNSNQSQRFQKVHILRCTDITPLSQRSSTFLLIGPSGF